MPPTVSEEFRPLRLVAPSARGGDELRIRAFDGEDRLGSPFEYRLELRSATMDVSLDFVGSAVAVEMAEIDERNEKKVTRWFHGYITDFSFVGNMGDLALYSATMRPWLWFLSQKVDNRVFQEKGVEEIIKEVFAEHGFSDYRFDLKNSHETRTYCVQYGETDLDFVSRLMEEEGIYYYFEHSENKHDLLIVDSDSGHEAIPDGANVPYRPRGDGSGDDHLNEWAVQKSVISSAFMNRDYDFEKPKASLEAKCKLQLRHENQYDREVYVYPGGFSENTVGERQLNWLKDGFESQHERIYSEGNVRRLRAGYLFTLEEYPRQDQNAEYLIVAVRHTLRSDEMMTGNEGDEEFYRCNIEAIPKGKPYRSPPLTPKPIVRGPQTAMVVGPKGEEIWCDKYGRVKVQFHWDRVGSKDQNSSCWVRVSQAWAGNKWGAIHTPRIGQEVVVSFLEGDPDKPLITGGVYNADNMPPYALPANQTQSGIKSHSSKDGTKDNFNELRFEDKKGDEEVYLQAEKDCNVLIKNRETRKVGGTRETIIGYPDAKGEDAPKISDDAWTETVYGGKKIEVKGKERFDIATESLDKVGRKVNIKNGDEDLEVSLGDISRKAVAGKITDEALTSIELKVGPSSILIDNAGVTIKGMSINIEGTIQTNVKAPLVQVEANGPATFKGLVTSVEGSTITQVKGTLVKIN